MTIRVFNSALLLASTLAVVAAGAASVGAQASRPAGATPHTPRPAAKPFTVPRTPWGDPDIQGNFTNVYESGTPLEHAPFLTEGRRAELRAQNLYTVEALADIEGNELKNLGPGGREMKNQAMEYIAESRSAAPSKQMMAELEALRARNIILEEDLGLKKQQDSEEGEFAGMSLDQLREFITVNTGQAPMGSCNRKTLIRMAQDARPNKVA